MGFWDGKKPFRFWEAYGGGNYSGELKSFSIREFFILNKLAPSLHLSYDAEELPISVKPEKPVDVTDVMALLSETYEGTEYDMTKNLKVAVKKKRQQRDRYHYQPGSESVDDYGYGKHVKRTQTGCRETLPPCSRAAMLLLYRDPIA